MTKVIQHSYVLDLDYRKKSDGSIVFSDGIEYEPEELLQMRKLTLQGKNTDKLTRAVHKLKKAFDCTIDFVYV